jgi:Ser/Thr protein kinase RdoA (MazF antagonist)
MTDASQILAPLDFPKLDPLMQQLFDLGDIQGHTFVHGGYMGQNYRIDTQRGVYFLKQYQNRINTIIHEIKTAEQYFASQGLPVILPIRDRYDREAFWLDGNWYSLFPFINGVSPSYGKVTAEQLISIAHMLARFHQAGRRFPNRPFQLLRMGNRRKFNMEKVELERLLGQKQKQTELDHRILEILAKKEVLIHRNTQLPQNIPLAYDSLLHGDFQYFNIFMNELDEVTHVYDLERASMGPCAYEVVRSLIMNCFDNGWEEKNFALGRTYLSAYREQAPLTLQEFRDAVKLYTYSIMHMTWIETRYVVFGIRTQLEIFERHVRRLEMLTSQDQESFCQHLWK